MESGAATVEVKTLDRREGVHGSRSNKPRQLRQSCSSIPCEPSRPLRATSVDAAVQGAASFRCPGPRLGCRSVFGLRGVAVARLARDLRRPKLAYVDGCA